MGYVFPPCQGMAEFHQIAGYDVVATLGQGAASTLYSVRDKKGVEYCLKRVIKKSPSEQRFIDQAIREYEVGKVVKSPMLRVVHKLIRQRALIRTNEVLVLMELIHGRTLESVKFNGMSSHCKLLHAAASGLKDMHDAGYVHADIKPNNILIDNAGCVKLIDFGQSCKHGTVKERIQGTPDYIAPEQVRREPITYKTDLFNLGATMYWMLTGKHVPTLIPKKDPSTGLKIRSENTKAKLTPPIEIVPACPPALSNLIVECVASDPSDRPPHMQAVMDRVEIAASQAQRAEAEGGTEPAAANSDGRAAG